MAHARARAEHPLRLAEQRLAVPHRPRRAGQAQRRRRRDGRDQGTSGGEPQALFSDRPGHLYVALIDGTVKESKDGGATWTAIVTPPSA